MAVTITKAENPMVPASLARSTPHGGVRNRPMVSKEPRWRPPNVPLTVKAELRALTEWLIALTVCAVIIALGYVWVRLQVVEAGYELSATRQLVERLEAEGRELAVRAAAAAAPGRLETLARTRLAMRAPQRGEEANLP